MIRPINPGLSPNLEFDDIILAAKNIFNGNILKKSAVESQKVTNWFNKRYEFIRSYTLNSGRGALYLALKAIGIHEGDEVLVTAFTCVAVPNSVLWCNAKPVYVDIVPETLGMDPNSMLTKITERTKAVIIQYTFSITADIEKIVSIAKSKNIAVIENCAHGILIKYNGKLLGQYGDIAIFSFGRDKAISSVSGGLLSINNKNYLKKAEILYNALSYPNIFWIVRQHLHILSMPLILPLFNFLKIGRIILFLLQKLSLLDFPVSKIELNGVRTDDFPKKLPDCLSKLVINQLDKLHKFNSIRVKFTQKYNILFPDNPFLSKNLPLLRYPLLVKNPKEFIKKAKKEHLWFGNWYSNVIDPHGVNLEKVYYNSDCKNAENIAQQIINLPTYPTLSESDFSKISNFFNRCPVDYLV